jgi:putative phosphoesterase
VVADTHVPDRANDLHPRLIPALQAAGVDCILHAGDVSSPTVLATLARIAPVEMACGNRDWPFFLKEKWVNQLELGGVRVALMHGHGSWLNYIFDKGLYMFQGYRFERYKPLLKRAGKGAKVIVFGHTHYPEILWDDGQLLFNPGSAGFGSKLAHNPSWGILEIFPDGKVTGKIFALEGYQLVKGQWIRKD